MAEMPHEPSRLRAPSDLENLTPDELVTSVRPLIWRSRLASSPESQRRHEENVPAALVELAHAWHADPVLSDGRQVGFGEYVAVRLAVTLREMDGQQRPEMYDSHRRFEPGNAPELLGDDDAIVADVALERSQTVGDIAEAMQAAGIPLPSQMPVLDLVAGVRRGEITTGRAAAKALGEPLYKTRPATGPLLAAIDVVADSTTPLVADSSDTFAVKQASEIL